MINARKKFTKKIMLLFVCLIIILLLPNSVFAENDGEKSKASFKTFWSSAKSFVGVGEKQATDSFIDEDNVTNQLIPIMKLMISVGIITLLISTLIIGIKYMASSATDKAGLKKKLVGVVIATIVLASSYTIWSLVYSFVTEMSDKIAETEDILQ